MELDSIKFHYEKAFNCFRIATKLGQFFEVLLLLGIISWSSARVPSLFRTAVAYSVDLSTYLFNHHIVFLIGNFIIVSLFLLCSRSDAAASLSSGDSDLYNDYVKLDPSDLSSVQTEGRSSGGEEEKQIVVRSEEIAAESPSDDIATAIEKATKQIKRFQRTQSEKLEREIRATAAERLLRRSETQNRRKSVSCGERFEAEEMERLSSEEFRRRVDAFIDAHWCRRKTKQNRVDVDEYKKYQLVKMA